MNDDITGGTDQRRPGVASDGNGNFVIVWEDQRNGQFDIYFQRYDASGTPLGTNQMINDDNGVAYQGYPSVDMDDTGRFVVAWEDGREGHLDIYFQIYDETGAPRGVNRRANDDADNADQWDPAIAMNGSGGFVVTWGDPRNGHWDIFYQCYAGSGTAQEANKKVNDDDGDASQESPSVTLDDNGNFIIAWEESRHGHWDAYFQHYDAQGVALGSNRIANDDTGTEDQVDPSVAMHREGGFVIVWEDNRNENPDIYFQRYNALGVAQGSNQKVNTDNTDRAQLEPTISMDASGNFIIAWDDYRDGNGNVMFQRYDALGNPLGANRRANNDIGDNRFQGLCSSAMAGTGEFIIVWWDYRHGEGDVYFQRYDASGSGQGSNRMANDVTGIAYWEWISYPTIAMDAGGRFLIAWQDTRNSNVDIFFQRYDASGTALGENRKANEDHNTDQYNPWVIMHPNGRFFIAWEDWEYGWVNGWDDWVTGQPDIVGQHFDSTGARQDSSILIVSDGPHHFERVPIAVADADNIIISWEDSRRSRGSDIYAKIFPWDPSEETIVNQTDLLLLNNFALDQNLPNPFNPVTTIRFTVKEACRVILTIYDVLGREVSTLIDEDHQPGSHQIIFNAGDLPSGIYFYSIRMKHFYDIKKMVLMQ